MKSKTLIVAALLIAALVPQLRADETPRPLNICFFLADDMRHDCIGAKGAEIVKTPNIDKLCEAGFFFRNAYTLGADRGGVCMPSRAMIAAGRSYFRKDVQAILQGGKNYQRPDTETPLLGQTMKKAGYASIRSGKFASNPVQVDRYFDIHVDGGHAEQNANNLIRFVQEHAGRQPLFLYMAPHEPHDNQYAPKEYYA